MTRRPTACPKTCAPFSASILLAGAAAAALLAPVAQAQAGSGNWYFFGDSNIGQGNFSAIVGSRGEDFFPNSSNNGFERDSNGLVWAEMMGRDVDIVLDPDADSPNINFAISGAHMTRGGDLVPFGVETGVTVQTEGFGALVEAGALEVGQNDVAFMIAGANDVLDRLDANEAADTIIADVAEAAAGNIERLADHGIRTVIISEIQPLQYAPLVAGDAETQAELAALVDAANTALFDAIAAADLPDGMNVVTMKYSDFMAHIDRNAAALGFDSIGTACFDEAAGTLCATTFEDQNRYLFLDDLHMTEAGHRLAAQWWMATLEGANGEAARETGRMPSVIALGQDMVGRSAGGSRFRTEAESRVLFADYIHAQPRLDGAAGEPDARFELRGFVLGGETRIGEHTYAGAAASIADTDTDLSTGGAFSSRGRSAHGWAGYRAGAFDVSANAVYGVFDIDDIQRQTGVDLLTARASTQGRYWDVSLAASVRFDLGEMGHVDLRNALSISETAIDGYAETGADGLALAYEDQTLRSERYTLEAEYRGEVWAVSPGVSVRPVAGLSWRHEFGPDSHALTSRLIDNTALPSTIRSAGAAENRFDGTTGFDVEFGGRWMAGVRYTYDWSDDIGDGDSARIFARMTF